MPNNVDPDQSSVVCSVVVGQLIKLVDYYSLRAIRVDLFSPLFIQPYRPNTEFSW